MCDTIVSIAGTVSEKQTAAWLKGTNTTCDNVDLKSQYKYQLVTCFVKFPYGKKSISKLLKVEQAPLEKDFFRNIMDGLCRWILQ